MLLLSVLPFHWWRPHILVLNYGSPLLHCSKVIENCVNVVNFYSAVSQSGICLNMYKFTVFMNIHSVHIHMYTCTYPFPLDSDSLRGHCKWLTNSKTQVHTSLLCVNDNVIQVQCDCNVNWLCNVDNTVASQFNRLWQIENSDLIGWKQVLQNHARLCSM